MINNKLGVRLLPILIIITVCLIVFYPLLGMYFWRDDFSGAYTALNNLLKDAYWPYFFPQVIYFPMWKIFGLNPEPHFAIAIFLRIITSITLYIFLKSISSDKILALLAALLFAVSPIGIESSILIVGFIENYFNLILQVLFLTFFFKKKFWYSSSMLFFLLAISPHRGLGFLFFVLLLILLIDQFRDFRINKTKLFLGYIAIALSGLFFSYTFSPHFINSGQLALESILGHVIDIKTFGFFFLNSLVPSDVFKDLNLSNQLIMLIGLWLIFFYLNLILYIKYIYEEVSFLLFFGFLWIITVLSVYYLYNPYLNLSESRYYTPAAIGGALILISSLKLLNRIFFITSSSLLIIIFSIFTNQYLSTHLQEHSKYAKEFWSSLKREVPFIKDKTMLVILLHPKKSIIVNRYADIARVGNLPSEAAVAVHYGIDYRAVKLVDNWDNEQLVKLTEEAKKEKFAIVYLDFNGNTGELTKYISNNLDYQPIRTVNVNKLSTQLDNYEAIRSVSSNYPGFPWVYFEVKYGTSVQDFPLKDKQYTQSDSYSDHYQTAKGFTHSGMPGATLFYHLYPKKDGEISLPTSLYGYKVIGISHVSGLSKLSEDNVVSEYINPNYVETNGSKINIKFDPKKKYFIFRVAVNVGIRQIDINPSGTVENFIESKILVINLTGRSDKIEIPISDKISSWVLFSEEPGKSYPYAFVNGKMLKVQDVSLSNDKLILKFLNYLSKGDQVIFPVASEYAPKGDEVINVTIDY